MYYSLAQLTALFPSSCQLLLFFVATCFFTILTLPSFLIIVVIVVTLICLLAILLTCGVASMTAMAKVHESENIPLSTAQA